MIHQLKCPGLRDTVPEICYSNVKLLGKFRKAFFGPSKLLMVSLLTKCKNLHISSPLSHVIMSPNNGVEITLFCGKIQPESGFLNNAHMHKQGQYNINFSLCHRFPWPIGQPLIIHARIETIPCVSVSLTVMSDNALLKNQFKNIHNL
jgi:hypothetical protein